MYFKSSIIPIYQEGKNIPNNPYTPNFNDLLNFTMSFETFNPNAYKLNGQWLAGYGSANPEILKLAREGKLTEDIAKKEVESYMKEVQGILAQRVPNWNNLSQNVQYALMETAYNIGPEKLLTQSPKLMQMLSNGVTDPKQLVTQMDHNKNTGGWIGVRSAARRAMATGNFDWLHKEVDKYGRQIDSSIYQGKEDYKASPYYNKYKNGGVINLKRI